MLGNQYRYKDQENLAPTKVSHRLWWESSSSIAFMWKGSQDCSTGCRVFSKATSYGVAVMLRIGTIEHSKITASDTWLGTVYFLCPE